MDPVAPGFAYGFGLFETMKLAGGRLCFWSAHWARLRQSADALGLDCGYAEGAVLDAIRSLVRAESLSDGTIKLSLFADKLYVYSRPMLAAAGGPIALKLDASCPINERSRLAGHKTHNYMENFLLLQGCRRAGYFDVLRVNTAGYLGETTVGNLFIVRGGRLYTPSLDAGILPGVVRGAVLAAARQGNVDAVEALLLPEQLRSAEAVFMTNSSGGILPVEAVLVDGEAIFSCAGAAHPVVEDLVRWLADAEKKDSIVI